MSTVMGNLTEPPVPAGGDGVDASTMPPEAFEGHKVGALLGLLVGSGAPPTQVVTPPPFPEGTADSFVLAKPFNADQLRDELIKALQRTVDIGFANVVDGVTPSDANPGTLWVTPSGLDSSIIQTVLDNHSPVDGYNTSAANKAFSAVLQKIAANQNVVLTDDERLTLLKGLALDYLSRQSTNIQPTFTPSDSTS